MKRKRAHINLKTKLVAALCALVHEEDGRLVPIIPHEHAKAMSEDQILSLFAWDHYPIPHAEDGPDEHWNIVPSLIPGHRIKTATIDAIERGFHLRGVGGNACESGAGDLLRPLKALFELVQSRLKHDDHTFLINSQGGCLN